MGGYFDFGGIYMFPIVSVIVPVYNSEKYLTEALNSLEEQTFKNFEVIIVNDGSTDNSEKIIKDFVNKNSNFKLINQKNMGPGYAKNTGIRYSKGKYIAFLDSDDFFAPNFLEILYNLAVENKADIAYCNFNLYHTDTNFSVYMPFTAKSGVYSREKAFARLISDFSLHHFPWNKLYKKSLFTENNIEFFNMFYEDIATCPKIFYFANKVVVTSKPLYYYRRHSESIIAKMTSDKINDFVKSLGITRNFLESMNEYQKYRLRFKWYAKRIKLQVYYCILLDYMRNKTLEMIMENFKNASNSIDFFTSDDYVASNEPLNLPYYVNIPKKVKTDR